MLSEIMEVGKWVLSGVSNNVRWQTQLIEIRKSRSRDAPMMTESMLLLYVSDD